ncbi:hypothetical protein DFH06DRAFT_511829 [Mycena polygramma]|nr:hypothetical protein DFH06DRAFT_511829 [Mycena polygramma]
MYFWASMETTLSDVNKYMRRFLHRNLCWWEYTVWIRPSTGCPCIDLTPPASNADMIHSFNSDFHQLSTTSLLEPLEDSQTISSIALKDYHDICYYHLAGHRQIATSKHISIKIGSIRHCPTAEYKDSFEVAYDPASPTYPSRGWSTRDPIAMHDWNSISSDQDGISRMEDGWIRVKSSDVTSSYCCRQSVEGPRPFPIWLAQANHIFDRLEIICGFENYLSISTVDYHLDLPSSTDDSDLPLGYLFLCPPADLESGTDSPAYWSLDPSGVARLNADEGRALGFPQIDFVMVVWGYTWDETVYAGIRQFQEAKGFNPLRPDVALELGYTLYQACERNTLDAHFESSREMEHDRQDSCSDSAEVFIHENPSGSRQCGEYEFFEPGSFNSSLQESPRGRPPVLRTTTTSHPRMVPMDLTEQMNMGHA